MPEPLLRPASLVDLDAVTRMLTASYGKLLATHYDADLLAQLLPIIGKASPVLLASGRFHVAEMDGKIVAGGGWSFETPGTKEIVSGLGHIRHVGTHPDFTGSGLARAIVERCLEEARGAGLTDMECWSTLNGVGFYERMGFSGDEVRDIVIAGIPMPSVIMRRRL